ncbi:glycosyltransferase family 4 protein [Clostridium lacusfryxellense]|uniref:glycosyltransferase family 4 protein n=1 Tax=Clostridium lacusfryxellense TaxID=205328 RepID=UPI001C0AD51A|nr:glycosyltransferase family 4 protein [Clostridium lacusfryxellense]MBU3111054.1 glycosyltransferase family 4 protein [Clostridium lacusfryxellense]
MKTRGKKKKICMIVPNSMVKGGIASVVNGYRCSSLVEDYNIVFIESYMDGSKFEKLFKGIKGYINYFKVLITEKPNIIHIHSAFGASFYRKLPFIWLSIAFKVPIINHIHGSDFDNFYINNNSICKRLITVTYCKCDKIIVLADEWKEKLKLIVPSEKIVVIENYCDAPQPVVREKSNKRVLFLGVIGKHKGCYDIPKVIENVVGKEQNCHFIIAGTGEVESIKELLRQKKIEKYVEFPGWLRGEDKDKALRESDVFFLPSYNECMPMSVLEGMGYSLPIVSTNVGGIPKLVHNLVNGFLCEPGDVDGFSEAIIKLLSDDKLAQQYGKASYAQIQSKYTLEKHVDEIEKLYSNFDIVIDSRKELEHA